MEENDGLGLWIWGLTEVIDVAIGTQAAAGVGTRRSVNGLVSRTDGDLAIVADADLGLLAPDKGPPRANGSWAQVTNDPAAIADMGKMHVDLVNLSPAGGFFVAVQVAFYGGMVLSAPIMLYFIAEFVFPALRFKERKYIYRTLFIGGGANEMPERLDLEL